MRFIKSLSIISAFIFSTSTLVQANQIKAEFIKQGESVAPWEFSLQFGQVQVEDKQAKTTKSSLVVKPTDFQGEDDAISLKWKPRGVKNEWGVEDKNVLTANILNRMTTVDYSVLKETSALVIDLKVVSSPKKNVELTMECNWNWKCRSTIPLKQALKRLPKNEWVSFPIPLKCFDRPDFDFSKITSPFMLYTSGKMSLDIANIRIEKLTGNSSC